MKTRLFALFLIVILSGFFLGSASKVIFTPSFDEQVESLLQGAGAWLPASLEDNGLFVYALNPQTGEYSASNNEIRQLMASRALAKMSQTDSNLLPLHKKNLATWVDKYYREKNGVGYVLFQGESKLGGNAMLLRTIVSSPYFDEYADKARLLARGILALQNPDGSMEPWYIEPGYEYDRDYLLSYYSGEALTALTEYYKKTNDKTFLDAAIKSAQFYLDKYVTHLEENYYPTYVAWHTMAYFNLYEITREKNYADAIFTLNDKLLEMQDTTEYIGRFYNPETPQYGVPHSASDGVYTEGLVYAYDMAKKMGDTDHARRYLKAIKLSVKNLYGLQYREPLEISPLVFDAYRGAIRTSANTLEVRVDNAQHVIDALTHITEVLNLEN